MKELSVRAQMASSVSGLRGLISGTDTKSVLAALTGALPTILGRDPFASLGPAPDSRQKASRAQIGPAVAMYKALKERLGQDEALEVMRQVILPATISFLRYTIADPPVDQYIEATEEERRQLIGALMQPFFNATSEVTAVADESFTVEVRTCDFPMLCTAAGVPELASLFCEGDISYFNREESPVHLDREYTLAQGGDCCPFVFSLNRSAKE